MSHAISTNKEEIPRWNFKNSLKLNLKKLDKPVSHQVIFESLDQVLSRFQKNQITSIYNFGSNKFWIIEFNSTLKLTNLFECPVKLNDQEFKLEDANKIVDPRKYCTFRIHFLPTNFNTQLLHNFFNVLKINGLKIEDISEETYKDSTIKNGVKRVKISFPKDADPIIQSLPGPTVMYGLKCVFTIAGQKPKCYFCNDDGHNIAKCPHKQSICGKCQQKGHLTQKCSLAEKLKSLERSKTDYSDLYVDESDEAEHSTNIESYTAAPKTPEFPENWNMEQKSRHSSTSSDTSLNTPVLKNFIRQKPSDDQSQVTSQNKTNHTPVFTKNRIKRQSESESKNKPKKQSTNREEEEDAFESFISNDSITNSDQNQIQNRHENR